MTTGLQTTQGQAWRGYMAIENLNLSVPQRQLLVATIQSLGPQAHFLPDHFNHWRVRLDNQAVIFEAQFDADNLSVDAFKHRLANIVDVDEDTIAHAMNLHTFASIATPAFTFSRAGTDYLRVAPFAGLSSTWAESAHEARAYLAARHDDWTDDRDLPP